MSPRREPDFDESADMRLIELQRAALGVATPQRSSWESNILAEGAAIPEEPAQRLASAIIAVEATAHPAAEVIPGAIVTLSLSLTNEGSREARNVRVTVPLPGGAGYRNGSFVRDGRPMRDDAADEFFSAGTLLAQIAPKSRATFLWKIGVRLGNRPLVIAPSVEAEETAIIGARPLLISRKETGPSGFASEVLRYDSALYTPDEPPIYELDEEENLEHEAAQAALSDAAAYRPPMQPPAQPEPEPEIPVQEPAIPGPPEQPPDPEPAAREAIFLIGRLDRPSVAYFERIFGAGKSPTLLNHFILGGALACTQSSDDLDAAQFKPHLAAQGALLQRIVLHEKLGRKEPITEYAGSLLAQPDRLLAKRVPPLQTPLDKNLVLIATELEGPGLDVLRRIQSESARWDFTKARQLTLALQGRTVVADAPRAVVENAQAALQAYAQTTAIQLQRFFVRMRIDRTTGVLFVNDPVLDAAARALVQALADLF